MSDNVAITAGAGTNIAADELTDGTLGSVKVQFVKLMDGTLDSSNKLIVDSHGSMDVTIKDAAGVAVDFTAVSPVKIDQTTPGTTNAVQVIGSLPAGSALLGKVTTDQTTHGTSDLVAADITKIAGATVPVGHGVAATAMRVELPSDGTGVVGLIAGAALVGKVGVDQTTPGTTNNVAVGRVEGHGYETVAASQTAQAMGATGATGDDIDGILVIPATTSPGNVLLLDNATSITVFTGGATSVSNLVPFYIPLGMRSISGAWKITTGANVSCIGIGRFT